MRLKPKATATAAPPQSAALAANIPETPDIPPALTYFDRLPDIAFVRLPVVCALNSIGPATVWRWVKSGKLPAPQKRGPNVTVWQVGALRRAMSGEQVGG